MTREEFNSTPFGPNMIATYEGNKYRIMAVEFTEGLLGLAHNDEDDVFYVRCENVDLNIIEQPEG